MGEAAGNPLYVSGFYVDFGWWLAVNVASQVEVGDGDYVVRGFVFVARERGTGGHTDFGGADFVLDEKDFLRGARRWRVVGAGGMGGIAEKFDGNVAEGLVGEIAGGVGEASHQEAGISVLQLKLDGRFAGDCVFDFGIAERDENVVVVVAVDERLGVRGDFDSEYSDIFVFENEVVGGFGGDGNFLRGRGGGLGNCECREEEAGE
jgi:hypothetical protein